jgi:hypothetical protein
MPSSNAFSGLLDVLMPPGIDPFNGGCLTPVSTTMDRSTDIR